MNITFLELSIRNFLSYGNNTTRLQLDFTEPTLVVGKNYDYVVNGQIGSNGAGKTVILNAIAFCLYDKTISRIEKSELVNYINDKNMEISVIFEKAGIYYKVVRYRKNKSMGGDGVRLYENTSPIFEETHQRTSTTATADIETIIGIPFDIFARIVVISATYEPFLSLPGSSDSKANQRDIIEELFNMTEMTRKADELKKQIKENNTSLKGLIERNERITAERLRTQSQLNSTKTKESEWNEQKTTELESAIEILEPLLLIDFPSIQIILGEIENKTKTLELLDRDVQSIRRDSENAERNNKQLEAWKLKNSSEIYNTESTLTTFDDIDVEYLTSVENKVREYETLIVLEMDKISVCTDQQKRLDTTIGNILTEIEHLSSNTCPYCKQTFSESKATLTGKKKEVINLQTQLDQSNEYILELAGAIEGLTSDLAPYKKVNIPPNLKAIDARKISLGAQLASLKEQTNPYTLVDNTKLVELLEKRESSLEICKVEINSLKTTISLIDDSINWSALTIQRTQSEIEKLTEKVKYLNSQPNLFGTVVIELEDLLNNKLEKVDTEKVDELDTLLEHQEFLLKLLTKKDSFIRKALLNKNISFLNTRLSHYLTLLGLPHKVSFTEEMGVNITQFGTVYKFANMSSGQKARINLSLSFAFRDVLQSRFAKINFCILDECLDVGLDAIGVQSAAKMLKAVAIADDISMLVISHRDEIQTMFSEKLELELRDGFSNVISGKILLPSPTILDT